MSAVIAFPIMQQEMVQETSVEIDLHPFFEKYQECLQKRGFDWNKYFRLDWKLNEWRRQYCLKKNESAQAWLETERRLLRQNGDN